MLAALLRPRRSLGLGILLAAALGLGACSSSTPAGPSHTAKVGTGVGLLLDDPDLQLRAAACPDGQRCVAVGTGGSPAWAQASASSSWTRAKGPAVAADLFDVSCASATACLAVGSNRSFTSPEPVAWRSTDAGASWVATKAPRADGTLQRVSCDGEHCVAVGIDALGTWSASTGDLGRSWTTGAALPDAMTAVGGLTCIAANCTAVGIGPGSSNAPVGVVALSGNRGRSWTLADVPGEELGPLYAISCAQRRFCHAVGAAGTGPDAKAVRASGTSTGGWHVVHGEKSEAELDAAYAVWCGEDPACITGGTTVSGDGSAPTGAIAAPSRRGRTLITLSYPPAQVVGVACADETRCVAVGGRTAVSFLP